MSGITTTPPHQVVYQRLLGLISRHLRLDRMMTTLLSTGLISQMQMETMCQMMNDQGNKRTADYFTTQTDQQHIANCLEEELETLCRIQDAESVFLKNKEAKLGHKTRNYEISYQQDEFAGIELQSKRSEEDCTDNIDVEDLSDLADDIGADWHLLCIELDINPQFFDKHQNLKDRIFEMLCHWNVKSKLTRMGKIDELRRALITCHRSDLVFKNKLFKEVGDAGITLQTQLADSEEEETKHFQLLQHYYGIESRSHDNPTSFIGRGITQQTQLSDSEEEETNTVDEKDLFDLAHDIRDEWQFINRELDVSYNREIPFHDYRRNSVAVIYDKLCHWNRNSTKTRLEKVNELETVLKRCDRYDLVLKNKLFKKVSNPGIEKETTDELNITEQDLRDLADDIGNEWCLLGMKLGIEQSKLSLLGYDMIYEMLCHWNNNSNKTRTEKIHELRRALQHCGRTDLVQKKELFKHSGPGSEVTVNLVKGSRLSGEQALANKDMVRMKEGGSSSSEDKGLRWTLFDIILKEYNGMASYQEVKHLFHSQMSSVEIKKWLTTGDYFERFHVLTELESGQVTHIGVYCILPLCLIHRDGKFCKQMCHNLHICHRYLLSQCLNDDKHCRMGHSFKTHHNIQILKSKGLVTYNERELKLLMSRSFLQVCSLYNGYHCPNGENCIKLHVCASYILETPDREQCKLSHNFNSLHSKRLIKVFQLNSLQEQGNLKKLKRCILVSNPLCKLTAKRAFWTPNDKEQREKNMVRMKEGVSSRSKDKGLRWTLFDIILKEYNGMASYQDVKHLFRPHMSLVEIKKWLTSRDSSEMFYVSSDKNTGRVHQIGVRCILPLCSNYCYGIVCRLNCRYLHICHSYLLSQCIYGSITCLMSHSLKCDHNLRIFCSKGLEKYSEEELKTLMSHSVLQVCSAYNGSGCINGQDCLQLHVCANYITEIQERGCKLDHSFNSPHSQKLLKLFHLKSLCTRGNLKKLKACILVSNSAHKQAAQQDSIVSQRDKCKLGHLFTDVPIPKEGHADGSEIESMADYGRLCILEKENNTEAVEMQSGKLWLALRSSSQDPNTVQYIPVHVKTKYTPISMISRSVAYNHKQDRNGVPISATGSPNLSTEYSSEMSTSFPLLTITEDKNLTYKLKVDTDEKHSAFKADTEGQLTYKVDTDENGGFYHMPIIKSQMYIPDGALAEETKMQIIVYSEQTFGRNPDMGLKSRAISKIYEFLPHGQRFMKYVTFRFPLQLMHRFDVGGLKMLYSATGRGEEADWQEILLTTSRGAHSSGLSWLVWERDCYVMMQHFCKIQVITTDTGAQTSALYVNASLIGEYSEQLQLVEMCVVFSCGEQDDRDQRLIFNSGKKVLSNKVVLLYENGGDIEMKLTLHDNQDWQIDEDEQTQLLDKNILFLQPLCKLQTLPDISFIIHQKRSTLLKGKVSLTQINREYVIMLFWNLDVHELKNDMIAKLQKLQEENQEMQINFKKLEEERQIEQAQKEKFQAELENLKKNDGGKEIPNSFKGEKSIKKSLLPVAKSRTTRENIPYRGAVNDGASTSQSSNSNDTAAIVHAPKQVGQWVSQLTRNKGTTNIIINHTILNNYNEPGRNENGLLALEDKTWPTGFDSEFYKYLFEFRAELDKDKIKLHTMAESLGIIHTNGFNAKELVTAWYVKSMGENNNNNKGKCDAKGMWVDLRNILIKDEHIQASDFLTLAIEKQRIRDNLTNFVDNLQMDYIIDKLYSKRVIDGKQKKDLQKDKLSVSELITEAILKADLQRFKAFKECLEETDQKVLLDMIKLAEEQ